MEKKLTVDRIESGIAICFDETGKRIEINETLEEGDIITVSFSENGKTKVLSRHKEEAKKVKEQNSTRLKALFARGDNNK